MSSLQQTPQGDLDFVTVPGRVTLIDDRSLCAAQKLRNRFLFFLGEWFLDRRLGVPYFQMIFVKAPDVPAIKQLFRRIILGTPDIVAVQSVTVNYSPAARNLSFSFVAKTVTGKTISGGSGQPFIVS